MKTKAVRLYGEMDLRLDEFELPEMQDDEIMAEVVTDSLCMSSYKAITQAQKHKKVPDDISENPIILGHEFCGTIKKVVKNGKISIRKVTNLSFSLTLEISEAMPQDILSIIWEEMPQRSSFLIRLWKMVHY